MSVKRRRLGSTGLLVSEIGFGALEIGRDWAADVNADSSHCSPTQAERVLNGLLDLGINFIDTAPAYWHSEEFIGRAIAHRRSEYILATKVGEHCDRNGSIYDYSYKATLEFVDRSLKRLQTDYVDLLQIHSASIEVLERGETLEAMRQAQLAGKVRHIGMTGGVQQCVRALELGGYETVQVPYNLLNLGAEERLLDLAREKDAGVIVMRGLAGGKLSPKFERLENEGLREAVRALAELAGGPERLVSLALGYVLARPEITSVIVGSRRLEAVRANLEAVNKDVWPADVLEQVRTATSALGLSTW